MKELSDLSSSCCSFYSLFLYSHKENSHWIVPNTFVNRVAFLKAKVRGKFVSLLASLEEMSQTTWTCIQPHQEILT